jgi:hypothetical protein
MRRYILASAIAALAASPVMAQHGGGHGGGPGGGMGAGPPMTPPGQMGLGGPGISDYARGTIASSQGQFGRDFAAQQRADAMVRVQEYRQRAEQRKADALARAAAARAGAPMTAADAARSRDALKADMEAWREAFAIGRRDWQAQRDQWLLDRTSLTPQQWALQRANWFAARDAWIAQQMQMASTRRR